MLPVPNSMIGLAIFVVALCLMPIAAASGCGVCPEACGPRVSLAEAGVPGSPASPVAVPSAVTIGLNANRDCGTSSPVCASQLAAPPLLPLRI